MADPSHVTSDPRVRESDSYQALIRVDDVDGMYFFLVLICRAQQLGRLHDTDVVPCGEDSRRHDTTTRILGVGHRLTNLVDDVTRLRLLQI